VSLNHQNPLRGPRYSSVGVFAESGDGGDGGGALQALVLGLDALPRTSVGRVERRRPPYWGGVRRVGFRWHRWDRSPGTTAATNNPLRRPAAARNKDGDATLRDRVAEAMADGSGRGYGLAMVGRGI
jgi:hypothetical protein